MTDRLKGCTVIFQKPIREDDAEAILNAIRLLSGVQSVHPVISHQSDWITKQQERDNIKEAILAVFRDAEKT